MYVGQYEGQLDEMEMSSTGGLATFGMDCPSTHSNLCQTILTTVAFRFPSFFFSLLLPLSSCLFVFFVSTLRPLPLLLPRQHSSESARSSNRSFLTVRHGFRLLLRADLLHYLQRDN